MHPYLRYATENRDAIIRDIRQLVEIESPSGSIQGIRRVVECLADRTKAIAAAQKIDSHVRLDFNLPGAKTGGRILGLGHSDTVWPIGTLETMPFRMAGERLWGPGVYDMKSGLVFFLWAVRLLRDLSVEVTRPISLLVVADEETGSKDSRSLTEQEAESSDMVLVLEPGAGLTGKLKTARKGIGRYTLTVEGVAAHAGVDFGNGANAIVELARQIERIAAFVDLDRGITVNPGVITGGTASNVVAARATLEIDMRAWTARDAAELDGQLRALQPLDERCKLRLNGEINRPPMERRDRIRQLFERSKEIGAAMGIALEESATGGGSDGNFTAALGVPTLDGLGAIGEGAHATNESILVSCISSRVALLAGLLAEL